MTPARIAESKKKLFTSPIGTFAGLWQNHVCWLYGPDGKIIYRFDTNKKCPKKRGEKITAWFDFSKMKYLIYEYKPTSSAPHS